MKANKKQTATISNKQQETQPSSTSRATHLCNSVANSLKTQPPRGNYHAKFHIAVGQTVNQHMYGDPLKNGPIVLFRLSSHSKSSNLTRRSGTSNFLLTFHSNHGQGTGRKLRIFEPMFI